MEIRITRESLRLAGACYDDGQIDAIIPETGVNLDEGLALDVPTEDKHWVLCCAAGVPDRILREHACWCARQALNAERAVGREPDQRSWHAIEVAERFARGEATRDELAAASDASDAARAASYAASYAASAAAWAAARDAAWAASYAARAAASYASYAASDAAWAAAWAAAWDKQLADLVARIRNAKE